MKQLWALCAALALFFSLTLLNGFYLAHFTQGLTDTLTQAEIMGEAGQWEQALTLTRQAHRKWQDHGAYLHTTLRHADIDTVHLFFLQTIALLETREDGEYSAANAALIGQLTLLWEQEQLTIQNLL